MGNLARRSEFNLCGIARYHENNRAHLLAGIRDPCNKVGRHHKLDGTVPTLCFAELSELERNIINERTDEGRALAKKRGVKFGRKLKLTSHQQDKVSAMLKDGQSIRAIARHFNVGVATIDRMKRKPEPS